MQIAGDRLDCKWMNDENNRPLVGDDRNNLMNSEQMDSYGEQIDGDGGNNGANSVNRWIPAVNRWTLVCWWLTKYVKAVQIGQMGSYIQESSRCVSILLVSIYCLRYLLSRFCVNTFSSRLDGFVGVDVITNHGRRTIEIFVYILIYNNGRGQPWTYYHRILLTILYDVGIWMDFPRMTESVFLLKK